MSNQAKHSQSPENKSKKVVFISYKWNESKEDVWKFAEYLESTKRFTVWLDKQEMYANKLERMEEGIKGASVVVIFFNDDYQDSVDCRTEAEAAYRHRKEKLFVKMQPNEKPVQNWFAPIIGNNIYIDYYQYAKPELEIVTHIEKLLSSKAIEQPSSSDKSNFRIERSRDIPAISSYISRPEVEKMLQEAFLDSCSLESTIGILIFGEGGIGKTMLIAKAIALNDDFLRHCGVSVVIWLNVFQLSQTATQATAVKLYELIAENMNIKFSEERSDAQDRVKDFFKLLKPHKVLLVIDDAFNEHVLRCAFRLGDNVRCIAVSRRRDVVGPICDRFFNDMIEIPVLQDRTIANIFNTGKKNLTLDSDTVSEMTKMCAGLPLLASVIKAKLRRCTTKRQMLSFIQRLSSSHCQTLISESWDESDKKRDTISELLLCGLENESPEFRRRFYAFLLFEEATNVAIEDLAILWRCDIDEAADYCSEFYNASMIRSTSLEFDSFNVHALMYAASADYAMQKDSALKVRSMQHLREMLLDKIEIEDNKNVLHQCLEQKRLSLIRTVLKVSKQSSELLFYLCGQQASSSKQTPFHLLSQKSVKGWVSHLKKISFSLNTVCELANMMLVADEERAMNILKLSDSNGQSVVDLLATTVEDGAYWYTNALHLAASKDFIKLISVLLHAGVNVDSREKDEQTPLRTAVQFDSKGAVETLLAWGRSGDSVGFKPVDINAYGKDLTTPLTAATLRATSDIVEILLKNGADVAYQIEGLDFNVIWEVLLLKRFETADLLFSYGANLDEAELAVLLEMKWGFSIVLPQLNSLMKKWNLVPTETSKLSEAIFRTARGMNKLVSMFHIGKRVEVKFTDDESFALSEAVYRNDLSLVKKLLLDKLFSSKKQLLALSIAGFFGCTDLMQLLLDYGVSVNGTAGVDQCPLALAATNHHKQAVQLLLANGADVNFCGAANFSPLLSATFAGDETLVKLLIEHGADVNPSEPEPVSVVNCISLTPLMLAAQNGNEAIARLLIEAGADVNATNKQGQTPLEVAEMLGYHGFARIVVAA